MSKDLLKIKTPITNADGDYLLNLPDKDSGEYNIAVTDDIKNATLTIQKNGTTVNSFSANASSNVIVDLDIPIITDTSGAEKIEDENNEIYPVTRDTHQVIEAYKTFDCNNGNPFGANNDTLSQLEFINSDNNSHHYAQLGMYQGGQFDSFRIGFHKDDGDSTQNYNGYDLDLGTAGLTLDYQVGDYDQVWNLLAIDNNTIRLGKQLKRAGEAGNHGVYLPDASTWQSWKTLATTDIIAPEFSTTSTYAVGSYVTKDGRLYRCISAVSSAGDWDSSKWSETSIINDYKVRDIKQSGKSLVNSGIVDLKFGYNIIQFSDISAITQTRMYVVTDNGESLVGMSLADFNTNFGLSLASGTTRTCVIVGINGRSAILSDYWCDPVICEVTFKTDLVYTVNERVILTTNVPYYFGLKPIGGASTIPARYYMWSFPASVSLSGLPGYMSFIATDYFADFLTGKANVSDIPTGFTLTSGILNGGTNSYSPYTSKGAGHFYTGTSTPTNTDRLNYDGNFYANKLYINVGTAATPLAAAVGTGTVTSVTIAAGTGLTVSNAAAITTSGTRTISVDSNYKLPTTTEWAAKQNKLYLHNLKISFSDEDRNTVSLITSVILATSSEVTAEDFYNQDSATYIRLIDQIRAAIALSYRGTYIESYVIREIDCQNDHTLNIEYKNTMSNANNWLYGYDGTISDTITALG